MIDDDYTLEEGDTMPDAWWRLDDRIPLTVRVHGSSIPGLPLLAYGPEFSGVLSVYGPRYLNLGHITSWNACQPWQATPAAGRVRRPPGGAPGHLQHRHRP